ncbi:hypothetical protein FORC47_3331 [Bacillus cereus]|nr:hypothetical protein FORC47_3331 [Bacillus cereus]
MDLYCVVNMKMVMKTIEIIVCAPECWIALCLLLNKQGVPF